MTPAGAETYIRSASVRLQSADSILEQVAGLEYGHRLPYLMAVADLTYGAAISLLNAVGIINGHQPDGYARTAIRISRPHLTQSSINRMGRIFDLHEFEQMPELERSQFDEARRQVLDIIREAQMLLQPYRRTPHAYALS